MKLRSLVALASVAIATTALYGCSAISSLSNRNAIPVTPEVIRSIEFNYDSENTRTEMKRQEDLIRSAHSIPKEKELPEDIKGALYDAADREDGRRDRRVTSRGATSLGYKLDSAALDISRKGYDGAFKDILGSR